MDVNQIISSGILEQYVLGLTSEEEGVQVEQYMVQYPEAREELDQISSSLESYAAMHAVTPSPDLKSRIFENIHMDPGHLESSRNSLQQTNAGTGYNAENLPKKPAAIYRINAFLKFAAAACFFLMLGSILLNISLYNKVRKSHEDIASVKRELEAQKQVAIDMDKDMSVVKNKMAVPVVLNGTPHSPESVAKIFWMKNTGDVYIDPSNLPAVPSDKQYQLWAIVDGKPVDGGMISSKNGDVYHIQKMRSFGKAQAFAITLEKAGGSPAPTMNEMVVIAKI